jgi:hypothetical protein
MLKLSQLQATFDDASNSSATTLQDLSQAFETALLAESSANLYALAMRDFILRMKRSYDTDAEKLISSGFAYEPWTEAKMKLLDRLKHKSDKVLQECGSGSDACEAFLNEIDSFEKEQLVEARKEFASQAKTPNLPPEGRMESRYIPAIKKAINIAYQIYELFQILDKNREDVRASPLIQAAESFARTYTDELLYRTDEKSLIVSDNILKAIQADCRKQILDATVARSQPTAEMPNNTEIDRVQLFAASRAFATKIKHAKEEALRRANGNIVTMAKKAGRAGASMASTAATQASHLVASASEKLLEYWSPMQGPSSSSSSSSANKTVQPEVTQAEDSKPLIEDYEQTGSPSASPVTKPLLVQAPQPAVTIDDMLDDTEQNDDTHQKVVLQ